MDKNDNNICLTVHIEKGTKNIFKSNNLNTQSGYMGYCITLVFKIQTNAGVSWYYDAKKPKNGNEIYVFITIFY